MIPDEAVELVNRVRLGYVATVAKDNTPNLSPKGSVFAMDSDHLVFADIRSPGTVENLRSNPIVEINVVDAISRRGYRFRGAATILEEGDELEDIIAAYKTRNLKSEINVAVKIKVETVSEIRSPLYDLGISEEDIRDSFKDKN